MMLTAFIMGLAGSFHCAAMCGPLVLAVPAASSGRRAVIASRCTYHAGRITCYAAIGVVFGAIGKSLALAGFQRWLSIAAGVAMLLFLLLSGFGAKGPMAGFTLRLKSLFGHFLQRRSYLSLFSLGMLNGLLPCGLVYVAGTASTGYGNIPQAVVYMVLFGCGTLPMMLGMALGRTQLVSLAKRFRLQPLTPAIGVLVAVVLILRGMSLGIPYVSPAMANDSIECPACAGEK